MLNKLGSRHSESELSFDLEDLCFRFFFFFLLFSFFFFLCFYSEELELLPSSSDIESSSNRFDCCILNT